MNDQHQRPSDYAVAHFMDLEKGHHVSAIVDRLLFEGTPEYGGQIVLISALGPNSAVRAILAAAATSREVRVNRFPRGRFYGREGGRQLTAALESGIVHGCYVGPQFLAVEESRLAILGTEPGRVFERLTQSMALPALPEWASWLCRTLTAKKLLAPLSGFGATGCTLSASEEEIDRILCDGVKRGDIRF